MFSYFSPPKKVNYDLLLNKVEIRDFLPMNKKAALQYLESHLNGNKNIVANYIFSDIATSLLEAGGKPPFTIKKIGQLAEEIGNEIDSAVQEIQNTNTEGEEISEALDPETVEDETNDESLFGTTSPASYNIFTNNIEINNNIQTNSIILNPDSEQKKILVENVQQDGGTVLGSIKLHPEGEDIGVEIPNGYNGIVSFFPMSRENGNMLDIEIHGYYMI
jgi:hypothetical protein